MIGVVYIPPQRAEQLKLALLSTDPSDVNCNTTTHTAPCEFEAFWESRKLMSIVYILVVTKGSLSCLYSTYLKGLWCTLTGSIAIGPC